MYLKCDIHLRYQPTLDIVFVSGWWPMQIISWYQGTCLRSKLCWDTGWLTWRYSVTCSFLSQFWTTTPITDNCYSHLANCLSGISYAKGHFDYPSLSQDFEWKSQMKIVLIYQVLTKQFMWKSICQHLMNVSQMTLASLNLCDIFLYM